MASPHARDDNGESAPAYDAVTDDEASTSSLAGIDNLTIQDPPYTQTRPRQWDDPPKGGPPEVPDEMESSVIVMFKRKYNIAESVANLRGIKQVAFTPSDSHVIAMIPVVPGVHPHSEHGSTLFFWDSQSGARIYFYQSHIASVSGGFACTPIAACDNAVAVPAHYNGNILTTNYVHVFDLNLRRRRLRMDLNVQAPLAYSPAGTLIAAVSSMEPSRIRVFNIMGDRIGLRLQIPHHIDEVTHLAFMPDGTSIVSLSKDGTGRVTSLATGRTLRKFEADVRHPPRLLQVSPDGELVVSVWGWEVMQWSPVTGQMVVYNVNAARHTEGWPLCISEDCQFLLCRTEEGFDIMDLPTGRFLGEATSDPAELCRTGFVTAAAFSSDNKSIVIGKSNGEVKLYEMVVVS